MIKTLGFQFKPFQKKAVNAALSGKDSLIIAPTGSGKSLCYVAAALNLPGTTIIISPLLSLIKDQMRSLIANGVDSTTFNSEMGTGLKNEAMKKLRIGSVKILFISPESLKSHMDFIETLDISLVVIDEAHCIIDWGESFRPAYKSIIKSLGTVFLESEKVIPLMALTATANERDRIEITTNLEFRAGHELIVENINRKNIHYSVVECPGKIEKLQVAFATIEKVEKGIVFFCRTRMECQILSQKINLQFNGFPIKSRFFHSGMGKHEKDRLMQMFMGNQVDVICSTIAFGMGVDKPDICAVIHWNPPGSINELLQESGRGGRDGEPAMSVILYDLNDIRNLESLIDGSGESEELINSQLDDLADVEEYCNLDTCRREYLLAYYSQRANCQEGCDNCG